MNLLFSRPHFTSIRDAGHHDVGHVRDLHRQGHQQGAVSDISPAALTGANRIVTGDIRLPLGRSYASISRVSVTIQSVTGNWTKDPQAPNTNS